MGGTNVLHRFLMFCTVRGQRMWSPHILRPLSLGSSLRVVELAWSPLIRPHCVGFPRCCLLLFTCRHQFGHLSDVATGTCICGYFLCLHAGAPAWEGLLACSQTRVFLSQANMALGRDVGRSGTQDAAEQGSLPSVNFWNTPKLRRGAGRVLTYRSHSAGAPRI